MRSGPGIDSCLNHNGERTLVNGGALRIFWGNTCLRQNKKSGSLNAPERLVLTLRNFAKPWIMRICREHEQQVKMRFGLNTLRGRPGLNSLEEALNSGERLAFFFRGQYPESNVRVVNDSHESAALPAKGFYFERTFAAGRQM